MMGWWLKPNYYPYNTLLQTECRPDINNKVYIYFVIISHHNSKLA